VFQEDNALYRGVIAAVMPDVFQKMDPEVTKRIRTFAKNYVPWLTAAMSPAGKSKKALPAPFVELRLRVAVAFAQVRRQFTPFESHHPTWFCVPWVLELGCSSTAILLLIKPRTLFAIGCVPIRNCEGTLVSTT
jgi:hypothetical protein